MDTVLNDLSLGGGTGGGSDTVTPPAGGPDMGGGSVNPPSGGGILYVPQQGQVLLPDGNPAPQTAVGNNLVWWVIGGLILLALLSEEKS